MVTFKRNIANKNNYGGSRAVANIRYIVIHYTANDGDHDEANANYFKNNIVKASAHYFVDDDSITQSVPDDYVAYSVGGNKYPSCSQTGGGKYYGMCTNSNSISIELCDVVRDGKVYPTQKTINNAIELTKSLMKKYGVPADRVIRHFDVVGKLCPAYWVDNKKWESEFHSKLTAKATTKATETKTTTKKAEAKTKEYLVRVTANCLNIRKTPNGAIVGTIKDKGVYTIIEEKNGWGKLKSGKGWISLAYTKKC